MLNMKKYEEMQNENRNYHSNSQFMEGNDTSLFVIHKKNTDLSNIYIYILDNASRDAGSFEIEKTGKSLFDTNFHYVRNAENKGFAIACNQGAELAREQDCEALLFLNNDTLVTENWLPPLLNELENPKIGLVGPLLLYPDNTVQHCGVKYDLNGNLNHIYQKFPVSHSVIGKQRIFNAITAAALLTRTQNFFELGKFCEEYKNGFEDVDLCFSYGKHGYLCKVVHESIVYHYESKTPGRLNLEQREHNRAVFIERNKFMKPDAHIYFENDGYLPALTKDYYFYVRLAEEIRMKYRQKVQRNYSDKLCYAMLMQEPYWHEGYFILFESLYKQRLYKEALHCCRTAFGFGYCFEELFDRFLECRKKIDSEGGFKEYLAKHEKNKKDRAESLKGNQLRLRVLVDEEWRRKLFLTRKLPVFDDK